jgi:hypothetical protein
LSISFDHCQSGGWAAADAWPLDALSVGQIPNLVIQSHNSNLQSQRIMNHDDFKKIILARMHALLKPLGFRKRGNTFSADRDDVLLFIQLQSSTRTTHDTLIATVNFGIVSTALTKKQGFRTAPNFLDSHWRERIGRFLPKPQDKWWTVRSEAEAVMVGDEIVTILQARSLPTMNSLASTQQLRELWESGYSPGLTDFQRRKHLVLLAE